MDAGEVKLNRNEFIFSILVIAYSLSQIEEGGVENAKIYLGDVIPEAFGEPAVADAMIDAIGMMVDEAETFKKDTGMILNPYEFAESVISFISGGAVVKEEIEEISYKMKAYIPVLLKEHLRG